MHPDLALVVFYFLCNVIKSYFSFHRYSFTTQKDKKEFHMEANLTFEKQNSIWQNTSYFKNPTS